ncbi:hypothetical protein [Sorangium cellulosum]|uniref:Uncharacterized protein n=1 Tax=Sorangium cellulosum TaxID=56 RepID=A0A150Q1H8_SORCE|nr:hypothetical protein BE15_14620 [Sorangium cellulosum]
MKSVENGSVDVNKALKQLTNGMEALKNKGLAGDVQRVELIMPKGAPLNNEDLKIVNGYLVRVSTGERITIKGFKNLVMVIEL